MGLMIRKGSPDWQARLVWIPGFYKLNPIGGHEFFQSSVYGFPETLYTVQCVKSVSYLCCMIGTEFFFVPCRGWLPGKDIQICILFAVFILLQSPLILGEADRFIYGK